MKKRLIDVKSLVTVVRGIWLKSPPLSLEAVFKRARSILNIGEDFRDCTKLTEEKRKKENRDIDKDLKKTILSPKALKAKRPGFTDDKYNETSYYMENGLRKVYPYYFTYTNFTKERWVGKKVVDVFVREFRAHTAEKLERAIKAGTFTVNYEKIDTDYKLKNNDLIAHTVHRHEVPVTSGPIAIVHMDEDMVVVNKPSSIPVLPCGRYRHNTVHFILAKEHDLKNLRALHRLDRLTSGILLFGRNQKTASQIMDQMSTRKVQKEYVCRVEGEFQDEPMECSEPIELVKYKIVFSKVSSKGKSCNTYFQKLGYSRSTDTSIVLCKPHTGRMHQIRVHLQYLGYPIVNDPLYNHIVFGPEKGKGGNIGKSDEDLIRDLINVHNPENWLDSELSMFECRPDLDEGLDPINRGGSREPSPSVGSRSSLGSSVSNAPGSPSTPIGGAAVTGHEDPYLTFRPEKMTTDPHCYNCKVSYRDPKPKDLVMYLHAWKYSGPGWKYETELPDWARVD